MKDFKSGKTDFWAMLAGGLGIGLAFGIACRYVLRFMRNMGATIDQQVSLTLALAYLSYYTANAPAAVSGGSCNTPSASRSPVMLLANTATASKVVLCIPGETIGARWRQQSSNSSPDSSNFCIRFAM